MGAPASRQARMVTRDEHYHGGVDAAWMSEHLTDEHLTDEHLTDEHLTDEHLTDERAPDG